MEWFGLHAVALPGVICRNVMALGRRFTVVSANGLRMAFLIISFASWALMLSWTGGTFVRRFHCPDASAQRRYKKRGPPNEIRHSRGWTSTKIQAVVDSYGNPVRLMISEGQRNDITYAIPLLKHIDIEGSRVLADRGYDSNHLIELYLWPWRRTHDSIEKGRKIWTALWLVAL